ncbi:MAG TPA: aromatic aminobenezylarsenical efflux permease ArsG family transporter [Anaerolineae bacterium]|nr:aromatic aminobenezylarsenical efflux permease ArsG family transporter [Anaerolineae bacterium]
MPALLVAAASALWLGILTSISPCPLATNIAAISFVGKRVANPRHVFLAGLAYTLGRSLTYLGLGILLVGSLLSVPYVSHVLQKYANKLLGPILIVVGMFLLEMLQFHLPGLGLSSKMGDWVENGGIWGAGLLGMGFALSFCPVSAVLFFGSLIPLAIRCGSPVLLPSLYGVGTSLPVFVFALLIALGARSIGKAYGWLTRLEHWARVLTGIVFVVVGIYYCLAYIFGVFS